MIFEIRYSSGGAPGDFPGVRRLKRKRKYTNNPVHTITINSLEELLELQRSIKHPLIIFEEPQGTKMRQVIEVYDSWRE
jgi:hypothetical protein